MAETVLITGASQGIGRETSLLFARKGYNLVLAARQLDRLEALAQEIRAMGVDAIAIPTDVRDPDQVSALADKALQHYGAIDVLINNAGIYMLGPVDKFSLDDWHAVIDTNLWGYIHTIYAFLPHFLERGKGTIVNVGSIGGKVPIPYQTPYTASKYAVTGMTEALHAELEAKGIRVCGIHPNFIKTDLMERAIFRGKDEQDAQQRHDFVANAVKSPLLETPEQVANAIWDAVKHHKSDVLVGSATISKTAYNFFPGLMQWVFRRTFAMRDSS